MTDEPRLADQVWREYFFRHRHVLSLVLSAFLLGLLLGGSLYWHAKRDISEKQDEIERVVEDKKQILRNLAAAEVEARVLRSSQANLKQTLEEREKTIAEQETSLEFYRQLMVVEDKKEGLTLNSYTVVPADRPHSYHFRFTFVQYAKQHMMLKALVNIRLEGREQEKMAVYYLRDLLLEADPGFGRLEFKYFQVLEGEMVLPAGFVPELIVVDAELKPKNESWQHKLPWQIEEL